jgi:hypothetical protein
MTDAIIQVLQWINEMVLGMEGEGKWLTGTLESFNISLYNFVMRILLEVATPVAYTILALFFVLELYKASVRTEGMGGGSANLGAEVVFKVMIRMVIFKEVINSVSLILNSIFNVTTHLTTSIKEIAIIDMDAAGASSSGNGFLDIDALTPLINDLRFWSGLVCLIICFIIYLITMIAVAIATVVIVTRFIELYIYVAIAPIPLATFPSDEMSQVGKGFLKSFAAVSLQGALIFIILLFFPYLLTGVFTESVDSPNIFLSLVSVMGYSIALILAVFSAGKWAKTICNAM